MQRLLAFAGQVADGKEEPLAREALALASRRARTALEKSAVQQGLARWAARSPGTPRAVIALALARARVAGTDGEARALWSSLVLALPDAPERAPDLFAEGERQQLEAAVRSATGDVKLARAEVLVRRDPAAAAALVERLAAGAPAVRLRVAAVLLAAGLPRKALSTLAGAAARPAGTEAERLAEGHLELACQLRLASGSAAPEPRPARRRGQRGRPAAGPTPPPRTADTKALDALAPRLAAALASAPEPRTARLLRTEAARANLRAGRLSTALENVSALSAEDPSTTLGAEDVLREAFALYLRRDAASLAEAGRLWDQAASAYRPPALRRRATYWAARARMASGDSAAARPLLASLLPGTAPDLPARWAARALGVSLPAPSAPPCSAPSAPPELPADRPGLPSRELLAAGLAGPAEDAAEAEGNLDPLFAAACAAERGQHPRAVGLLKARWPELGTPDEASAPPRARHLYYPRAQTDAVAREAAAQGLPAALLYGVIRQESVFSPRARSRSGAIGLMQVMPATGRGLYRRERRRGRPDLYDPSENVRLGASFLAELLRMFDGDRVAALAAYNAGPGRVARWKRETAGLDEAELTEWMPLAEPRDYVRRVLFYEAVYSSLEAPRPLAVAPRP